MNDSYTPAYREALACAPPGAVMINTIELRHDSIEGSLFLAQSKEDLELTLETGQVVTFEAVPFRLTLPKKSPEGLQELGIAIDNVDRRISDFCALASTFTTPVEVLYRPFLLDDPTTPQMDPPLSLFLKSVSITATEVSGRASYADIINKKFPRDLYTRKRFPGLGE